MKRPTPEEERVAETLCDKLTTTCYLFPCAGGVAEVENLGVKVSLGRREE